MRPRFYVFIEMLKLFKAIASFVQPAFDIYISTRLARRICATFGDDLATEDEGWWNNIVAVGPNTLDCCH